MSAILLIIGIIGIAFFPISICLFMTVLIGALRSGDDFVTPSYLKKFAIVIPAHDESALLGRTLESVLGVDYPKHLYEVFVIADNCSDDTAEIAKRHMRVQCLERFDIERRGKGYALQWFFEHLAASGIRYEAFLVVDADTIVSSNILTALNKALSSNRLVLNTRSEILNPDSSVTAAMAFLGYCMRSLRRKGSTLMGGSAPIISNGLCLSEEVIKKYGWNATSITEDREQWAFFYLQGISVTAVSEASISTIVPDTFKDFGVPRARWDMGELAVNKKYVVPFFKVLLKKRDVASFLNFIEIITPPFTHLFLICTIFFLLAILIFVCSDHKGLSWVLLWSANILFLSMGTALTLISSKASFRTYKKIFLYLPIFVVWRFVNLLRGYLQNTRREWIRSKRG